MATIPAAGYKSKVARKWIVPQGADTVNGFASGAYDDWDVAEVTARGQIRNKVGGDVWAEFTTEAVTGPRITVERYDGDMEGTDDDGNTVTVTDPLVVTMILPAATTEAEAWNTYGAGVYDLELIGPDGDVVRLAAGAVSVSHDVTRTA